LLEGVLSAPKPFPESGDVAAVSVEHGEVIAEFSYGMIRGRS
jgi:hypothetical protein